MGFELTGAKVWPVPPDWNAAVNESLAWGTDVAYASASAVSDHVGYRIGPRRSLSFEVLANAQGRRVAEMLLAGHGGLWQLPIWHDVQWLMSGPAPASPEFPCRTEGFDFVEGGQAMLYGGVNAWEIVQIDGIAADHLLLLEPPAMPWAPGMRLYPLRRARLRQDAEAGHVSDDASRQRLTFDIDEPCDWPALVDPTLYLTHPVLTVRADESEDPTSSYARLTQGVDYDGARPFIYDLPDVALRSQRTHWKLFKRPEHSWFRSLLYTCAGRLTPFWLPSWNSDLKLAAPIAGGSNVLSIEWAGYTLFGLGRHNRRDLRIELNDGTVHYRRIGGAVEAGATETLTLNASLDAGSIAPGRIRSMSFMTLATLASDTAEIEHHTDQDGTATCTLGWQAVVPDV